MEVVEKINIAPNLRFEGFQENWSKSTFASFLESEKSLAYGVLQPGEDFEGGIPMLRTVDLNENGFLKPETRLLRIPPEMDQQYSRTRLNGGELIISVMGTLGRTTIVPSEWKGWNVNRALAVATLNKSIAPEFLIQVLRSPKFEKKVIEEALGSAQKRINLGDLKEYSFTVPTLPEQQKIAAFLSAVDEKIQQLRQKKALLEKYKKGVMQKLFPKKAGQAPELRFKKPDGSNYPDWEEKKLEEITKYTKGYAFKSSDYIEEGERIVRVSDLLTTSIKRDNEKVFISREKALEFSKYRISEGNIIITTVGSKPEMLESAVGRGIYITNDNEGLLNQNMLKFENVKEVSNKYLIGLINSKRYQHYMKGIARGNANQANITVKDLLQYKVPVPSKEEQQKIADFLSGIDQKINQVETQINQTQTFKKGLLQQMFV